MNAIANNDRVVAIDDDISITVRALAAGRFLVITETGDEITVESANYAKGQIKRAFSRVGIEYSDEDLVLPEYDFAADPELWRMAGTEGTYQYIVLAATEFGRIGVRSGPCSSLRAGEHRVRVEPAEGVDKCDERFGELAENWKTAPNGQRRYSIVVGSRERLVDAVELGLQALVVEDGFIRNPDLPQHTMLEAVYIEAIDGPQDDEPVVQDDDRGVASVISSAAPEPDDVVDSNCDGSEALDAASIDDEAEGVENDAPADEQVTPDASSLVSLIEKVHEHGRRAGFAEVTLLQEQQKAASLEEELADLRGVAEESAEKAEAFDRLTALAHESLEILGLVRTSPSLEDFAEAIFGGEFPRG